MNWPKDIQEAFQIYVDCENTPPMETSSRCIICPLDEMFCTLFTEMRALLAHYQRWQKARQVIEKEDLE